MAHHVATAPLSEEEIPAELEAAWARKPLIGLSAAGTWEDAWSTVQSLAVDLFDRDELRNSERECLNERVEEALAPIRAAARAQIDAALLEAVLGFTELHPDAPRANRVSGRDRQ